MSTTASVKDSTVQTDLPQTATMSTNTGILSFESEHRNGYGSQIIESVLDDGRPVRYRSELTLSKSLLIERLRLLQEEAELEGQVQEARLATLRVKKQLLLDRIQQHRDQGPTGS